MNKKIIAAISLAIGINLFGFTETLKPKSVDIAIEVNDDMKLMVDCSYKEKSFFGFGSKIYSEIGETNQIMTDLCKLSFDSPVYEIRFKDFKKLIKIKRTDRRESKIKIKNINEANPKLFYSLFVEQLDYRDSYSVQFPITLLENSEARIELNLLSSNTDSTVTFKENNFIKSYKYDIKSDKVSIESTKPFAYDASTEITNTYNIDETSECINGEIWVKKYGAKSGGDCKWIESSK